MILVAVAVAGFCWAATITTVVQVVDGDTVDAIVAIWPAVGPYREHQTAVLLGERIRLLGVDAWELHGADREKGLAAREFTRRWLADHPEPRVMACRRDAFGRLLGLIRGLDGRVLADDLRTAGHEKTQAP